MKKVGQLYRENLIGQVKDGISSNENVFIVNFSHISGLKISDLRKDLKKAGAHVHISRNSMAQIALKDLECGALADRLDGQTAFVWSSSDAAEISKILVKFSKDFETVHVQGGVLEGKILEGQDVKTLSDLPSREVLLAMLFATIQAPLTRFAGALNAKTRELLSILKQLSEKSE